MIDKVIIVSEIRAEFGRVDVGYGMLKDGKCRTEVFSGYTSLDLKNGEYIQTSVEEDCIQGGKWDGWCSDKSDLGDVVSEDRRGGG